MNRTNSVKIIFLLVMLGLIGTIGYQFLGKKPVAPTRTYQTISGTTLSAKDLEGKVTLINFWATSCVTCVKEMPMMVDTYQKYKDQGYQMIAIAMSYDKPEYVTNFVNTRNLPFHIVLDSNGSHAKAFDDVQLTPTSILIDKNGNIIKRYLGEPNLQEFHAAIEEALNS